MFFENSDTKKKKQDEAILGTSFDVDNSSLAADADTFKPDYGMQAGMDAMKKRTSERLETLASPLDASRSEKRFKDSFSSYMLPKDTPERRKKVYALSQSALDDVVGDYYNNEVKADFEKRRAASKERGREEYMRYASVPGASPEDAYRASLRADNPMNVIDETIENIDNDKLYDKVSTLASYGGFDPEDYAENFVKPSLRDRMTGEYVEENTPKSRGEYIVRSALDNSLTGKVSSLGIGGADADSHRKIAAAGLANYDSDRLDDFVAGVGSLLVDAPFFRGFGGAASYLTGKATTTAAKRIASEVMKRSTNRFMNQRFADNIARRVITQRLGNRILQSSSVQGLTLGGYDIANSVADDIIHNGSINPGKAAGAFARGAAMGTALGVVGTPLRKMSEGLTGGKKMLSSAGVLSAESALFTAGGEIEKIAHGVEVAPIDLLYDFGESAATLLTMRMTHWRPKGMELKLTSDGRIKDELKLSGSEKQELRELNVDPEEFMLAVERELRMPSLGSANAEYVKESYANLMSNRKLSPSAKSKLMFIVENKVTSTPPAVFDYSARQKNDGTWRVEMLNANGEVIEKRDFPHAGNVKSFLMVEKGNIRRNRIAFFEKELTDGLNSQNFLRQAGIYAKERGVDVNELAEAMYKSANRERLSDAEQSMINEVMHRSSYSAPGMVEELYNVRRAIEKKHGLEKGSMLSVIDKKFFNCSPAENRALDDYEAYVRSEAQMLKRGTNSDRVTEMFDKGLSSMFYGYSNDDVKRSEVNEYRLNMAKRYEGQGGGRSVPAASMPSLSDIRSRGGYESAATKEQMEYYGKRAKELSRKFGFELNLITDKREIAMPDMKDIDAVMEYDNQLRALGWQNKGKIFINLPNMRSYSDLESTVVHEAVAHGGLRKVFGYRLYDFLEEVYKRADKSVLDGISRTRNQYIGADAYTVIEEYLAKIVEKSYPNARERSIMASFKDFIKSSLVKLNIYTGKNRKISEQELETLMRAHCRYVMKKKDVARHRKDVFGDFEMAHKDEAGYFDKNAYGGEMRELLKDDGYIKNTPAYILPYKVLLKYPYFSKEQQERIRKEYDMTEAEIEKQLDGYYYRFIGEKGAENMRRARRNSQPSVERSKELERKGYKADYIKFSQGWERGSDGKWRYETGERGMLMNDYIGELLEKNNQEAYKSYMYLKKKPLRSWDDADRVMWNRIYNEVKPLTTNMRLNDILQDFDLYDAYPEFANIPVRIVVDSPYITYFNGRTGEVVVNKNFFMLPEKEKHFSGTIQNMIQEYEGFGKSVSLRLASVERELEEKYRDAQSYLRMLSQNDRSADDSDMKKLVRALFKVQFGHKPELFKERFPTYDDYLFYKLTGKNRSFSGNVEAENVRARFPMTNSGRRLSMAMDTEAVPRKKQIVFEKLADLEPYFTGPLDIINKKLRRYHSDNPFDNRLRLSDDIDYTIPENIERLYNTYNVYNDEYIHNKVPYIKSKEYLEKRSKMDEKRYNTDDDKKQLN